MGALKVNRQNPSSSNEAEVVALSQAHCGLVTAMVTVNEGSNLMSALEDRVIHVWEVESRKVVRVLGQERTSASDPCGGKRHMTHRWGSQ